MVKYVVVGVLSLVVGFYVSFSEYRFSQVEGSLSTQIEINNTLIEEVTRQKDLTERQSQAIIAVHNRTRAIETYLSSK